ncbi:MAG TPA: DinB family protein [Bryobacteraceae bacterium]|nr:DinB family protein [Bryobacteraceae bacterium]
MKPTPLLASLLCATALIAQNPLVTETKGMYTGVKNNIIKAAEKMPAENYNFKPVPEVRSFGQLVGHIADAQYLFCSPVKGEENPKPGIEKGKTSKEDLTAALKAAFAYCDGVYDSVSDAKALQNVKFFGRERSGLSVLNFNTSHNNEHYGNIVTYMRIKGLVPPSSEGR